MATALVGKQRFEKLITAGAPGRSTRAISDRTATGRWRYWTETQISAASTQAVDRPSGSTQPIPYLRTANPLNPENLAAYPRRLATNRSA